MPPKAQDTVAELTAIEVSEVRIETYRILPDVERMDSERAILQMRLDGWRQSAVTTTHSAQILIIWER